MVSRLQGPKRRVKNQGPRNVLKFPPKKSFRGGGLRGDPPGGARFFFKTPVRGENGFLKKKPPPGVPGGGF